MTTTSKSYVVWRTYGAGFWSIIASTLAHCDTAEKQGMTPVVDMENHPSVYQEGLPVRGTKNVWEYYFEQPAGRSLAQLGKSPFVTDGTIPKGYPREIGHETYRALWQRHARLNNHAAEHIHNATVDLGISSRTLGVHFRGQEMRTALGHKFPPTLGQMNEAIRHVMDNYDFDEILLVTEAQQYVDALRKRWGSRLYPSPTFRLWRQNSYRLRTEPRKWHRYRLGMEALQDAHLLAACGGYIRGHSGLSEAALLISKEPFVPHIRISQGRNSFRPYLAPWLWYAKATLPGALGGFKKWIPEAPPSGG
jgi:hypothetical protein